MWTPLADGPLPLRVMCSGYVVTFGIGFITFATRAFGLGSAAFILAGIFGGLYGLLLATNFQSSAIYMSERGKRRLQNPRRFSSPPPPFLTEVPFIRAFGAILTVLCPLILISISLSGGA